MTRQPAHAPSPFRGGTLALVAFAVLVGLLAAATSGYGYGLSVSAVHLLEIQRTLDAGFLANDFWLNAQDAFGPRFYFRLAAGAATAAAPLWLLYAVAYVLGAVAASVATALAARDLAGSTLAAVVATPLAMWLVPFDLAGWPAIFNASGGTAVVDPQLLAEPLCFLALWRGIRGRAVQAAAISVPAILLHPTVGLGASAIALAAASAHLWRRPASGDGVLALAAGVGMVAVVALGCWIVPGIVSGAIFALDSGEVVHLVAHVAHPHHLVPSTWPTGDFLRPAVFWAAGALALAELRGSALFGDLGTEAAGTGAAIATAFVGLGCGLLCGWFFVEVVPSRWAATAYFYRLQSLVTWLCWIGLAAAVADALWHGWLRTRTWGLSRVPGLFAWLDAVHWRWTGLACLAVLLVGVVAGFVLQRAQWLPDSSLAVRAAVRMAETLNAPEPAFTLDHAELRMRRYRVALAAAARSQTPADAVILVPADWRHWRLMARRAVVVDRVFAFRDDQMREWHDRYLAVFDLERGVGYPVRATERWLRELARTVRFDYAVVPRSSCLRWRTLATSGDWKLVAVPPRRD